MVSAFLRMCPHLPSVAECFIEALRYYGQEFASERMAIVQGDYVMLMPYAIRVGMNGKFNGLIATDPFLPAINAAAGVTRFGELRTCLRETHEKICKIKEGYQGRWRSTGILQEILGN